MERVYHVVERSGLERDDERRIGELAGQPANVPLGHGTDLAQPLRHDDRRLQRTDARLVEDEERLGGAGRLAHRGIDRASSSAASMRLEVTTGSPRISGGQSHSWVIAASRWRKPSATIISVAAGRSETIAPSAARTAHERFTGKARKASTR